MPLQIPPTNPLLTEPANNRTLQMKKSLEDLAIGQEEYGASKAVAWSLSGPRDLITGIAGTTLDAAQAGVQTVPSVYTYVMDTLNLSERYWLWNYTVKPLAAGIAGVAAGALAVPASILYDAAHGVETIAKQGVFAGSRAVLEPLAKIAAAPLALTVTTFQNRNMRELMWASLKAKPANYTYTYDKLHEYQKKAQAQNFSTNEEINALITKEVYSRPQSDPIYVDRHNRHYQLPLDQTSSLKTAMDFAKTLKDDNKIKINLISAINKEMSNQFLISIFGIDKKTEADTSETIKKHIAEKGLNTLFGKYTIDGDRISLTVPAEINWSPLNLIGVSYRTNADDLLLSDMSVIANYVKLQGKTEITMTLEYPGTGNPEEREKLQDVYLTKQFEASLHAGFAEKKIKLVLNGGPVEVERLKTITAAAVRNYGKQQEPIKDKEEDKDDNKQVDSTPAAGGGGGPRR